MTLTREDYQSIINQIDFLYDGNQVIEIEKDGETFHIELTYLEYGYYEKLPYPMACYVDGDYIRTGYNFEKVEAYSFNEDGDTENDFDEYTLYKMAA